MPIHRGISDGALDVIRQCLAIVVVVADHSPQQPARMISSIRLATKLALGDARCVSPNDARTDW